MAGEKMTKLMSPELLEFKHKLQANMKTLQDAINRGEQDRDKLEFQLMNPSKAKVFFEFFEEHNNDMIEAVIVDVLEMLELRDRRIFISYLFESMVKNNDGSFPVLL